MTGTQSGAGERPDGWTLIALGLIAYSVTNFLHEAVGHGGMCWAQGGTQMTVSTMHLSCEGELSTTASKAVTASGTVVNLIVGALLYGWLRLRPPASAWGRHAVWLHMILNLYIGGGYLLFFSFFRIGDWGKFPIGLPYEWPIRIAQVVVGFGISFFALRAGWKTLWPLMQGAAEPRRRAYRLCRIPYYAGCVFALVAGALNPLAGQLILLSAVAASVGGTFWLWGMPTWNRDLPAAIVAPAPMPRSMGWIAAAVVIAILRLVILAPGVTLTLQG